MMHSRTLSALLLILISASLVLAQQPGKLEDPPWIKEVATQRIFYNVPGMERIRARTDLTYKRVGDVELKMDVYQPRNLPRNARRPAIIFIHGGALPSNLRTKPKEWGAYVSYGQLAAASGLVGITFNHRFYGWDMNALPAARSDVDDAIAYVRDNAGRLGVDKDRICLWALSAGSLFLGPAISDPPPFIRSLIFYYAIMDLEPLRKEKPAITDAVTREFSPLNHLKKAPTSRLNEEPLHPPKDALQLPPKDAPRTVPRIFPPIFIARAGLDEPDLNVAVDRFIQEALKKKATLDLSNHPNGQHGFDVLDDNPRTREIIQRTIEFIKTHR